MSTTPIPDDAAIEAMFDKAFEHGNRIFETLEHMYAAVRDYNDHDAFSVAYTTLRNDLEGVMDAGLDRLHDAIIRH